MKRTNLTALALSASLFAAANHAVADGGHSDAPNDLAAIRADGHAPLGVMGDHRHKTGEVMLSYRAMRMGMSGNQIGSRSVSPDTIATTVPNRFFGAPGQPPTLRVVPTSMTMDMHMFGAMYAPDDRVTLMAMIPYISKEMDHLTYMGAAGTAIRGGFTTKSEGIGDIKVGALIGVYKDARQSVHFNAGLSLPTGSITETGQILTPMGLTPTVRLPYAMQLGSGTYDLLPGLTYTARHGKLGWGAQLNGVIRLGSNNQGYSLGDEASVSIWSSYQLRPWISLSGRLEGKTTGTIDGIDPLIAGPVQTADPLNYGGETATFYAGVNLAGQRGMMRGNRLAIEVGVPVYQNLNGPQMQRDWSVNIGWQKAF